MFLNQPRVYDNKLTADITKLWGYANDYFTTDKPGNGLLLMGTVGTGKTAFFEEVQKQLFCVDGKGHYSKAFTIVEARDIVKDYSQHGPTYDTNYMYAHHLVIDDLGTDGLGSHFGTTINVLEYLILDRYKAGKVTHITTNLTIEELSTKYGSRMMDRLNEMCIMVQFKSTESLRK